MIDARHPRTPVEIRAVCKIIEVAVPEALRMSLSTPKARRPAEMLELHASFPDRLIALGVDPTRADDLALGIKVTVWVAEDSN